MEDYLVSCNDTFDWPLDGCTFFFFFFTWKETTKIKWFVCTCNLSRCFFFTSYLVSEWFGLELNAFKLLQFFVVVSGQRVKCENCNGIFIFFNRRQIQTTIASLSTEQFFLFLALTRRACCLAHRSWTARPRGRRSSSVAEPDNRLFWYLIRDKPSTVVKVPDLGL